jgi:hypothetical protein
MRKWLPLVLLTAAPLAGIACGGSNPPPETPPAASDGTGKAAPPAAPASDLDAGPTTTTTLTLADGGDLQGAKLTSSTTTAVDAGAASPTPAGTPGPHTSDPGRSNKDIQAIIVAHRDEARACYDAGQKAHPGIQGDLVVKWTIDPKGNVTEVTEDTARSQITEPSVVNCVFDVIRKIRFAESPRGFETKASYPFNFKPHGNVTPKKAP